MKTVGWWPEANAPWPGARRGYRLRRDHWLAGAREREWLARAMEEAIPGSSRAVEGRLVLFHRAHGPRGEYGVEVYSSAARLGILYYDGARWRFIPTGALASILESTGYPSVEAPARGRLKGKRLGLPDCPGEGEYLLVSAGSHVGPARILSRSPCTVRVRDMAPRGFRLLGESSLDSAVQANRAYIERLAAEARGFLESEAAGEPRVYVAVSGGIDSSVALHLAVEALGPERVTAVYADTGMEWDWSRRTVERLADRLGVDLEVVRAPRDPLGLIRERGLMGMEYRWCTRLLKLEPLRAYYRRVGARVIVDGARALESDARARTPRAGVNPVIPFARRLLPIHAWSRLEVQLYARLHGLPVNPLYDMGLQRIGCMVCPAMHLHELHHARSLAPGFYERLYAVLREMGVRDPEALLMEGGWRRQGYRPRVNSPGGEGYESGAEGEKG